LLVESLLLGLSGAALGVLLAAGVTRGVVALAAGQLPRLDNVGLDAGVLGFTAIVGVLAALIFGLVPALHTADVDLAGALREGGRGSAGSRRQGVLRNLVVAGQVALAIVVMLGAGLLGRSLLRLQAVDPNLDADRVLTIRIDPPSDPYFTDEDTAGIAVALLYDRVVEGVRALPGVEAAAIVDLLPMSGSFNGNSFRFVGEPPPAPGAGLSAETRAVGAGYFDAHGVPILRGRAFADSDRAGARRVIIASAEWVRTNLPPDKDPIGVQLTVFDHEAEPYTIVGVAADAAQFTLDQPPVPTLWVPLDHAPIWMRDEPYLIVRAARDPAGLVGAIRTAVRDIDPRIPVYRAATMRDVVDATLVRPRFRTVLLLAFAALAFLLAAIGVYGMVAYTVARRLPELGVRMALGADAGMIRRLVIGEGMRPVIIGAVVGLAAGLASVRVLAAYLYDISATDPATFIGAPVMLAAVAALAARLPARRAARLAPVEVLRTDGGMVDGL
jgi:putative ABC transport system permease protein